MKHDYHGKPASLSARLMRVARRYKKEDRPEKAAELAALPKRELGENEKKRLPEFIAPGDVTCFCVDDKNVLWIGTNEGLWRVDESEKDELDRVQCFRANACMFDNNVKAVEPDGSNGVWVLAESGVSHIEMRLLSVEHKANLHSAIMRESFSAAECSAALIGAPRETAGRPTSPTTTVSGLLLSPWETSAATA